MPPTFPGSNPGTVFAGRYRLGRLIGGGGAAQVFLGEPTGSGEPVAIKRLRQEHTLHPNRVERFRREAVVLKRLKSPHIVQFHEYEENDDSFLIALEYVDGLALDLLRREAAWVPPEIGILLLMGVARGLQAAHAAGVIHRDVRPANILLTRAGVPRLTDFGISLVAGAPRLTELGASPVRPDFRAPEMKRGLDADARTDVYALGVTGCELLTQNRPHQSEDGAHLLKESLDPTLDFNRDHQLAHKTAVARLVDAMLITRPLQRFQSMAELLENARLTLRHLDRTDSLDLHEAQYLALFARTIFEPQPANRAAWLEERLDRAAELWPLVNAKTVAELSACVRQAYFLNRQDPRVLELCRGLERLLRDRPELLPDAPAEASPGGGLRTFVAPGTSQPLTPGRLRVVPTGRKRAQLIWTPPFTGVEHVEVQRRHYPHITFETIAQLIPSAGTYTVTGLAPGQSYGFRLRNVNRHGQSDWSNEEVIRAGSFPLWLLGVGALVFVLGAMGVWWWLGRR